MSHYNIVHFMNNCRKHESNDVFTVFYNHASHYVGCVKDKNHVKVKMGFFGSRTYTYSRFVCFFFPSDYPHRDNVLYEVGKPASKCGKIGKPSKKYKNLCSKQIFLILVRILHRKLLLKNLKMIISLIYFYQPRSGTSLR